MPDWLWMAIFAVFIAIIAGTMLWECLNIATDSGEEFHESIPCSHCRGTADWVGNASDTGRPRYECPWCGHITIYDETEPQSPATPTKPRR